MAGIRPVEGCFQCGSMSHWVRDCPQRIGGFRPTSANAVPTGQPVLTLPSPTAAPASTVPRTSGAVNNGYQQPRPGWWRANQERFDVCYNKYLEDQQKETKRKEEEEMANKLKEEENRKSLRAEEETRIWKNDELRPGNKRSNVAVSTSECSNRGTPKPRWTNNVRQADKWREEYRKIQGMQQVSDAEVALLKEWRAEAEKKRMDAEKQVKNLQEQFSKLSASYATGDLATGGTNLKEKLEAAVLRSARKGKKATPGRMAQKVADNKGKNFDVNERFAFVENLKKQLCTLKKSGLEPYCKEVGIKLGRVEETIDATAEYRASKTFPEKGKRQVDGVDCSVLDVDDDEMQTAADGANEVEETSIEL
ncbi:hypothetical protein CBR_g195 [Chara braunii]|uniref:CCHC-type domain-containing protein n=1 Tax=Chara braunii TaxID=69332 RepID=A0A388JM32_CHABU|nr:hypothetical protein CBR_g195 [Chara braunii]|eukprot:GBG58795.1 hypothetical protein CBR_g195 [Chara braunii]